jgi:hypothetical protein
MAVKNASVCMNILPFRVPEAADGKQLGITSVIMTEGRCRNHNVYNPNELQTIGDG